MGPLPEEWTKATLPVLTPFNQSWFTSAALAVQRCARCGVLQHPPEEICGSCGSMEFDAAALSLAGTVVSYTIVHHPVSPTLADAVPYAVLLVALDDAPHVRVVGNFDGACDDIHIGMAVVPWWEELAAEDGTIVRLPHWRRAERERSGRA